MQVFTLCLNYLKSQIKIIKRLLYKKTFDNYII